MTEHWLSDERTRRLAELRAKYPKPAPEPESKPSRHTASVTVTLRFEYKSLSQEEAEEAAFHWMWDKGYEVTTLLYDRYCKDGLRDITLSDGEPTSMRRRSVSMTFFEFVSGILQTALDELRAWNAWPDDYWKPLWPEDVNEVEIEHASHYSKDSLAWSVSFNRHGPRPKHMTILYAEDEGFVVDDL